jgi:5-methylcytosine-specific restriction endonuclease McrA
MGPTTRTNCAGGAPSADSVEVVKRFDTEIGRAYAAVGEAEEILKKAKRNFHNSLKDAVEATVTTRDWDDLLNHVYWNHETFTSEEIADAFGLPNQRAILFFIRPVDGAACDCCHKPIPLETRTSRKGYAVRRWPTCKRCQEERAKSSWASWSEKQRQEETERQARISAAKTLSYADYLKTDWWMALRTKAYKKAGYRCQLCNNRNNIAVHHRTYERLGNEDLDDLIVLCKECHGKFHEVLK